MSGPEKKVYIVDYMLHADKSRDGYKINRAGRPSDPSKLTATEARVLKAFDRDKKYDMSREDFAAYIAGDDRTKYDLAIKNK